MFLEVRPKTLSLSIFTYFLARLAQKLHKSTENVNRSSDNQSKVHNTSNLDNCVEKTKFEQLLVIFLLDSVTLLLTILTNFSKIDANFVKNSESLNKTTDFGLLFSSF